MVSTDVRATAEAERGGLVSRAVHVDAEVFVRAVGSVGPSGRSFARP